MTHFLEQDNYKKLREIVSEHTSPIVLWLGAGLSQPAGMPSWIELRDRLSERIEREIPLKDDEKTQKKMTNLVKVANAEDDLWEAFRFLTDAIGRSTFESFIKDIFKSAPTCKVPSSYTHLSALKPAGVINLNLDKLATRALIQSDSSSLPTQFSGTKCQDHMHCLRDSRTFVINLHGTYDDVSSWVLRPQELDRLKRSQAYRDFLRTCILSKTLVFCGISAEDEAIRCHFEALQGDHGLHFWITDRRDQKMWGFCDKHRVLPIVYDDAQSHAQLIDLVHDLVSYRPVEQEISAPVLQVARDIGTVDTGPNEFDSLSENDLRYALNAAAQVIVEDESAASYARYEEFRRRHAKHIHQAWFVDPETDQNKLFGYVVKREIAEGAFGRVFEATNEREQIVAIKLLKQDVMRRDDRLQAFRRGVKSMKILSQRGVQRMVPYLSSSEIPAFVAMEYVPGVALKEAVENQQLKDWPDRLRVLVETAETLRQAHHLPERVLHRDLRPANIMLRDFDYSSCDWQVAVLDFDLAWYKGSNEVSIDHTGSINGFLAPEQVERNSDFSTRNALVDSYGMGMTVYYVTSGVEPSFTQHRNSDWGIVLHDMALRNPCNEWRSLPCRICKLVHRCTLEEQHKRPDMSQIWGELSLLQEAINSPSQVKSTDLMADELGVRVSRGLGQQKGYCCRDGGDAHKLTLIGGAEIKLTPNETDATVEGQFRWANDDHYQYKNVKSNIKNRREKAISLLKKARASDVGLDAVKSDSVSISFKWPIPVLRNRLDKAAKALVEIVGQFRF